MSLAGLAFAHRRALLVVLVLLVAGGTHAAFTLPRSIYPRVEFPRIAVVAEAGEQPVRGMLIGVTRPIEQAVSAVPNLVRVRSKTLRGASELSLDFHSGSDMREALAMVRSRVSQAGLASDVVVTIEQQTPAIFPVLSFSVLPGVEAARLPVARAQLAEWVDTELRPRIARLPDTFIVTVQTGDVREFVYEADPGALSEAGVDLLDVKAAITASNQVQAVGRASQEGLQYQLLVDGRLIDPTQLLEVAVPRAGGAPVRLADLGRVVEATTEQTMVVTGGGVDGVVVSVFLRDGGKVTQLSQDVTRVLDELRSTVPGRGHIVPVYDQARLVDDSIAGVRDAIALGALLSVVVIAIFLGSWRLTLVTGIAIPISVCATLAILPLVGDSLNLMSLGGLAVAIGLIIDDAIVVVENIARRNRIVQASGSEASGLSIVDYGTREVIGAVVGSSLTTIVVFVPLSMLDGVVGQFFRSLCLTLSISILASMLVAIVYTPLLMLLPGVLGQRAVNTRAWMIRLQDAYQRALTWLLDRTGAIATLIAALVLACAVGVQGVETGFLPEMDEGGFVLDYSLPVGTSLSQTDTYCRDIERILLDTPEIGSFSRRTGAELGLFATEQFSGDMLVGLVSPDKRERSVFEVIDGLRVRLAREVPQAEVEFIQVMQDTIADLAGNPSPLEVKFFGSDYADLQSEADRTEEVLDHIQGILDVKNHVAFGSPELIWTPDPVRVARLGLSTGDVASQTGAQLVGSVATQIQQGDRFIDVRVKQIESPQVANAGPGEGPAVYLRGGGRAVPIAAVADFRRAITENEVERENQTPMVRVTASVEGRDLGAASAAVEHAVRSIPHSSGVRVEFGGQAASQKEAFSRLVWVFAASGGLVVLLLVFQFRSLRLSLVMLLTLPFGQLGGLYALILCDVPLNISSGMGLIMLVGLVVKNGIILIEYAQQLVENGHDERAALIDAARTRMQPILMTSLAAVAGLLPLALGLGSGSELQRPLAIAVIGGLLVATPFTLIVIPLGCASLARGKLRREVIHAP